MSLPRLLHSPESIAERVGELGAELTEVLDDGAVIVGVLKGCLPFLADLVRCIDRRIEIDFVALSAFAPDSGRIRLTRDIAADVTDRQVVLVEGVVDTGFRVDFLRRHLVGHCTSEVRVCTLFDRSDRRVLPVQVDHAGFVFDEGFVVGYGLDHQGLYRNLSSVVAVDLTALEAEHRAGRTEMTDEVLRLAGSGADAGPEEGSRVPA